MSGQAQPAAAARGSVFRHVRYENLVAGVSGGVLSNLALHPLDLVKIRFAGEARSDPEPRLKWGDPRPGRAGPPWNRPGPKQKEKRREKLLPPPWV